MLSPGWGSPRCGEYGGALLRRGIAVKRRRGQAGMAKGSPSRAIGRWRRPPFQWESMGNSGKPSLRSWWTICVHQTSCGQPSRRLSRPVVWSIWLSSRTIAPIAVSRGRRAGWRAGKAAIWARMSGEALQRIQRSPSSDRAMEDCVRGWAATLPSRTPRQLRQLQFHWGSRRRRQTENTDVHGSAPRAGGRPRKTGAERISGWRSRGSLRNRDAGR